MGSRRNIVVVAIVLAVVAITAGAYFYHVHTATNSQAAAAAQFQTPEEQDNVYVRFDMEAYDDIKSTYWQTLSDDQIAQLFQLSLAKAAATSTEDIATSTREGVAQMLSLAFQNESTTTQQQLALGTVQVALYNLLPNGRSNLLSSQAETQLVNTVNNVNPSANLYSDLGVTASATPSEIATAAQKKLATLSGTTTDAGKAELTEVQKAAATLANTTNKAIYDSSGAQATVFSHVLNSHTLYIYISSVAPSTLQEFASALVDASSTPNLTNLVLDLRGNIGGDLSFAQEFLALFFGPNQYAFDLFHQGNLEVQRTANIAEAPEITRFREIAVLTDNMTQSTAELSASALKHDHLAYMVGATSRGWGSVETLIPMKTIIDPNETYALELVEYLTVRYDGNPIEGNGVVPDVAIADSNWRSELPNYFDSSAMVSALESVASGSPIR